MTIILNFFLIYGPDSAKYLISCITWSKNSLIKDNGASYVAVRKDECLRNSLAWDALLIMEEHAFFLFGCVSCQ